MTDRKIYRPADLETPEFKAAVEEARQLWFERCKAYVEKNGDAGSCVLGAGIAVYFKGKGQRKVSEEIILPPMSPAQGSSTWEESVQDIIKFLESKGVVGCYYAPGRLD